MIAKRAGGDRADAGREPVDAVGEVDDVHDRRRARSPSAAAASSPRSTWSDERQREVARRVTPESDGISAAPTWPTSLSAAAGRRCRRGRRRRDQRRAPAGSPRTAAGRRAGRSRWRRSTPAKIARPPSSGVARSDSPRSLGWSTAPTRRANRATRGVSGAAAAATATMKPRTASSGSIAGAQHRRRRRPVRPAAPPPQT